MSMPSPDTDTFVNAVKETVQQTNAGYYSEVTLSQSSKSKPSIQVDFETGAPTSFQCAGAGGIFVENLIEVLQQQVHEAS